MFTPAIRATPLLLGNVHKGAIPSRNAPERRNIVRCSGESTRRHQFIVIATAPASVWTGKAPARTWSGLERETTLTLASVFTTARPYGRTLSRRSVLITRSPE